MAISVSGLINNTFLMLQFDPTGTNTFSDLGVAIDEDTFGPDTGGNQPAISLQAMANTTGYNP